MKNFKRILSVCLVAAMVLVLGTAIAQQGGKSGDKKKAVGQKEVITNDQRPTKQEVRNVQERKSSIQNDLVRSKTTDASNNVTMQVNPNPLRSYQVPKSANKYVTKSVNGVNKKVITKTDFDKMSASQKMFIQNSNKHIVE